MPRSFSENIMSDSLACGCVVDVDSDWGIKRSIKKCPVHIPKQVPEGLEYFARCGVFGKDNRPLKTSHQAELLEAMEGLCLSPFKPGEVLLEVGCGTGMYITLWLKMGLRYHAIEPCGAAVDWISAVYNICVHHCLLEDYLPPTRTEFDVVFSAHVLEHFEHSPSALIKMCTLLRKGGRILLLVPEGTDLMNPDHLWFYDEKTLVSVMERVGFKEVKCLIRSITTTERYLFATGVRA